MIEYPQRAALTIGKTGCYKLCIDFLAEEINRNQVDILATWTIGRRAGAVANDGTILDAGKLLSVLTGTGWECIKAGPGHPLPLYYQCEPGEREILRFERPQELGDTASTDRAHFVVGDGKGRLYWDPYGDSHTVKAGKIVSKRIFRRL